MVYQKHCPSNSDDRDDDAIKIALTETEKSGSFTKRFSLRQGGQGMEGSLSNPIKIATTIQNPRSLAIKLCHEAQLLEYLKAAETDSFEERDFD